MNGGAAWWPLGGGCFQPLPHGGVVAGVGAALQLAGDLGEQAVALRDHVEAGVGVGLLDHRALVRALHQLVDLAGHRGLDDAEEPASVDIDVRVLGAADVEGSDAPLVVGGYGDGVDDAIDLGRVETLLGEADAGAVLDQALGTGAGGHALGLDSGEGAGAALGGDGGAEEGVELLSGEAGDGGRDGLGVAGLDSDLGAEAALALADSLCDVRGETFGAECLAEDDGVDGLVDDLFEAGHVDAGLLGVEVDEALEVRVVEGLVLHITGCSSPRWEPPRITAVLGGADADDLLDADDADA